MLSSREERVTRNETTTREINEGIEQAHEFQSRVGYVRVLCECGREDCDRLLAITVAEYEQVRSDALRFVVARDHVIPDVERVVSETDRYVVVTKREGAPAAIAREEDPRT
jgi:hypothetical protein